MATLLVFFLSLGGSAVEGGAGPIELAAAVPFLSYPVLFIENVGQFDPRARFQVQGSGGALWLAEDALWLTRVTPPRVEASARPEGQLQAEGQPAPRQAVNLKLSFVGANAHPSLEPFNRQETVVHYYHGSDPAEWHTHVPVWSGVRYRDLYPGVDLVIGQSQGSPLRWYVEGRDGADLSTVRLRVEGAEEMNVAAGHLHLSTSVGGITLPLLTIRGHTLSGAPVAVSADGGTFEITAPYASTTSEGAHVTQMDYPEEAYFGAYLGGDDYDGVHDIALSGQGDILDRGEDSRAIWITGQSTSNDFPTEPGSTSLSGASDAFVTKIKRSAVYAAPVFSAYIGGSDEEAARGIATDADGNAYLTGWTTSGNFPATANAFDQTHNTCSNCVQCNSEMDGFIVKLDTSGELHYATYLGGSHFYTPDYGNSCGYDYGAAIVVGAPDIVYLTGLTRSDNFPTTPGAYDRDFSYEPIGLNEDTFVVKLDLSKGTSGLLYGTFIGGGTISRGQDIAIDESGNVYVTGRAEGFMGLNYFPTTPGAYITGIERGTPSEAFILKLNPAGNGRADLLYSTFLGTTTRIEQGEGIALDAANHVYVIGSTDNPNFPTTSGAFDTMCGNDGNCNGGYSDVFIAKLNPGGHGEADLLYSTFLGGIYQDEGRDITLDAGGDVYVTGKGAGEGFPITPDAYASNANEFFDVFVTRLRFQGRGTDDLVYSTAVGGSLNDEGIAMALDEDGRVYVAGETLSWDFPTTSHASDKTHNGQKDAFVFRVLAPPPPPDLSTSTKTVTPDAAGLGEVITYTVQLINRGTLHTTASLTDTLSPALLLQGSPTASTGDPPAVSGPTITWIGEVDAGKTVTITYAAQITPTGTSTLMPPIVNRAYIADGMGNVYLRQVFVNPYDICLPLVVRSD
jgi:uncharacterized repeat protein (TIGR01451 family)